MPQTQAETRTKPPVETRAEILLQKRNGKQTIGIHAQGRKRRDLMTVVVREIREELKSR